jgi:hypothetical protein
LQERSFLDQGQGSKLSHIYRNSLEGGGLNEESKDLESLKKPVTLLPLTWPLVNVK